MWLVIVLALAAASAECPRGAGDCYLTSRHEDREQPRERARERDRLPYPYCRYYFQDDDWK
jgi:hypothetical protein